MKLVTIMGVPEPLSSKGTYIKSHDCSVGCTKNAPVLVQTWLRWNLSPQDWSESCWAELWTTCQLNMGTLCLKTTVLYPPPQIPVGLHMDSTNPPGLHVDSIQKRIQPTILFKIHLDSTWTPPGIQVASIWSWPMYSALCKLRKITTLARGHVTWSKVLRIR